MDYIPHTKSDITSMLKAIGANSIDDLFSHIPKELINIDDIGLKSGSNELQVSEKIKRLSKKNISLSNHTSFLGGGIYDHYIPPALDALANRSEFYTAYTPYQPEASQGVLQSIIEYQSIISRLTAMDISNGSLYDGSSALAEAVLMAVDITKKSEVIVSNTIHPEWIEVLKTYLSGRNITIKIVDHINGQTDFNRLKSLLTNNTACCCIQSPNFFGIIEDYRGLKADLGDSLLIVGCYPFSLGFLPSPGDWKADIVVGDGQSLGSYMAFGGPHFGFLSCRSEYIRRIPGRVVGETNDVLSQKGYCLTFQTREQHIKRERATSNICSNQALMALRGLIYLSLLGEDGLKEASNLAYHKAHYLQNRICSLNSFKLVYDKPFFNEFLVHLEVSPKVVNEALLNEGFIGGLPLEDFYGSDSKNLLLLSVTEKRTKKEMDAFIKILQKFN